MAVIPRSPQSVKVRNVLRVLGVVLLLVGIFLVVRGGMSVADEIDAASSFAGDDTSPFASFLTLAGGLFLVVFGLGALNAGFLGAQARYASGEVSPAVRELGGAFRGDQVSREVAASESESEEEGGTYCSSCGVRGDRGARFCDACGHALG